MKLSRLREIGLVAIWLVLLDLNGCNRNQTKTTDVTPSAHPVTDAEAADSHARMLTELRSIEQRAYDENSYFSERALKYKLKKLKQANAIGDQPMEMRWNLELGLKSMQLGRTDDSIAYLKTAHDLFVGFDENTRIMLPPGVEKTVLFYLGVASLRKAEDENCVNCRTGESCILPIQGTGVHEKRQGSEDAMKYFKQSLDVDENNVSAIWLLNLAAMTLGEHPDAVPEKFRIPKERFESNIQFPRFHNIANDLGLDTMSHAGGVIADDFDGDELIDIIVSDWNPGGQIRFFHNNGDGSFSDRTKEANLTGITGGLNTVHADFDNDGDLDVLVLRGAWLEANGLHINSLLRNDGKGRFTDVTYATGLGDGSFPTQTAAWADYDNDGDLDCFVGNETYPSQLFQNDGNGLFTDVALSAGVTNDRFTKGCSWGDFDGDRNPDLYVSNLAEENRLYRNNGDGTFTDVAKTLGVSGPLRSFPTWFWDFNNDGILDIFVCSYDVGVEFVGVDFLGLDRRSDGDVLYQGVGPGQFRDVTRQQQLLTETQTMGSNYGDLDNDGYLDFYLGTGYPENEALMPNIMYRNNAGETFTDVTFAGGFGHLQKGHGVAFADFDHDGDQDIFVEMGGAFRGDAFQNAFFENPGFDNNWIKISLVGKTSNRFGVGARIKVTINEPDNETQEHKQRNIYRWVTHGSSFGANPYRQEIGIGKAKTVKSIEVYWPTSDTTQTFTDVKINQLIEIHEQGEYRTIPLEPVRYRSGEVGKGIK